MKKLGDFNAKIKDTRNEHRIQEFIGKFAIRERKTRSERSNSLLILNCQFNVSTTPTETSYRSSTGNKYKNPVLVTHEDNQVRGFTTARKEILLNQEHERKTASPEQLE